MSKKKREEEARRRKRESRAGRLKSAAVAVALCCVCVGFFVAVYQMTRARAGFDQEGNLVIQASKFRGKPQHIDYGGSEELIVFQDESGELRTVLDTCEECFPKGDIHFSYNGTDLVCSYCGNTAELTMVGRALWGSCQPVSIPVSYRMDSGDQVIIPAAVLQEVEEVFRSWRAGDYSVTMARYGQEIAESGAADGEARENDESPDGAHPQPDGENEG